MDEEGLGQQICQLLGLLVEPGTEPLSSVKIPRPRRDSDTQNSNAVHVSKECITAPDFSLGSDVVLTDNYYAVEWGVSKNLHEHELINKLETYRTSTGRPSHGMYDIL